MTETRRLLRAVALAAGSVIVVAAGVLANLLTAKSTVGILGTIAVILGTLAVAGIVFWRLDAGNTNWPTSEAAALKRIRLILSASQDKLVYRKLDIDVPLSVMLKSEGRNFRGDRHQTISAFIASLTSDPRCTIVTGAPGSGKSTLVAQLAVQMMDARESGKFSYVPLMLQCKDWDSDVHLSNWIINQTRYTYGITNSITRRWLNRGLAILLIDGLDEIPDGARSSFIPQLNTWLRSAVAGRAVVSCRTDSYIGYFKDIVHEQVANLEPLSNAEIADYLLRVLDPKVNNDRDRGDIRSLLTHVISPCAEISTIWSTPLLVRLLADSVIDLPIRSYLADAAIPKDPAALALDLGDKLREQGNETGALESYMAAIKGPASQWRSIAGVRASLLLARSGEYERAQKALQSALVTEIERSYSEPLESLSQSLSDDERAVLKVLSPDKTLDAFQVSSLSSIPPSRCNEALRSLRDRSLVEVADKETGEPRFRRSSALELVDQ